MPACRRVVLTGTVAVPLPPDETFPLFTPEGERTWAEGWDPRYPAGDALEPGLVFVTGETVWTVLRVEPGRAIAYSRVSPGERAGRVSVRCEPDGARGTTATVEYDLTALRPEANAALDEFAAGYDTYLAHCHHAIAHALAS